MAGHFNFDGISLERFYHFICRTDQPTFDALKELGIEDTLRWRDTTMGFFDGRLHRWGDPVSLLRFPALGLIDKLRYGFFAFVCLRRDHWSALEHQSAKDWIIRYCGSRVMSGFGVRCFNSSFTNTQKTSPLRGYGLGFDELADPVEASFMSRWGT